MAAYDSARIAHTLTTTVFTPTRLREGYNMAGLDGFIDQVVAMVKAGESREGIYRFLDSMDVERTRFRAGYDVREVEEFFQEIRAALAVSFDPATPRSVASSPTETTKLVTMIENVRFQQTKYSNGYVQEDVDDFLDYLIVTVKRGKRGSEIEKLVDDVRFGPAKFREGYDMDEVDEFLDKFVAANGGARMTQAAQRYERRNEPVRSVDYPKRTVFKRLFGR